MYALVATVVFQKKWDTTCACRRRQPIYGATGTTPVGTDAPKLLDRNCLKNIFKHLELRAEHAGHIKAHRASNVY